MIYLGIEIIKVMTYRRPDPTRGEEEKTRTGLSKHTTRSTRDL
jgi:hypothetical protein